MVFVQIFAKPQVVVINNRLKAWKLIVYREKICRCEAFVYKN